MSFLALTWSRFSSEHRCRSDLTTGNPGRACVAGDAFMNFQINCSDAFGNAAPLLMAVVKNLSREVR